ncbi:MAG: hypothetical protein JNM56_36705 [Planctomycetia bacterium]|nr:hypothetical protein [Planctomycetia bacterium]
MATKDITTISILQGPKNNARDGKAIVQRKQPFSGKKLSDAAQKQGRAGFGPHRSPCTLVHCPESGCRKYVGLSSPTRRASGWLRPLADTADYRRCLSGWKARRTVGGQAITPWTRHQGKIKRLVASNTNRAVHSTQIDAMLK